MELCLSSTNNSGHKFQLEVSKSETEFKRLSLCNTFVVQWTNFYQKSKNTLFPLKPLSCVGHIKFNDLISIQKARAFSLPLKPFSNRNNQKWPNKKSQKTKQNFKELFCNTYQVQSSNFDSKNKSIFFPIETFLKSKNEQWPYTRSKLNSFNFGNSIF